MLDSLRKNATSSPVVKFIFGAIVVVFIFFGVGTVGVDETQVVARVNDTVISNKEFERSYSNLVRAYRDAYPQGLPAELMRQQVLDQLINAQLLTQEADRLGLRVEEDELRQSIAAMPDFQVDGQFNKDQYVRVLQLNAFKPSDFEDRQRESLLLTKLQELVRSGVHVSDEEVRERYNYENERVALRFVKLSPDDFLAEMAISDDESIAYLAAHQDEFREPERARVSYVAFRPEQFAGEVKPSDEDIQAYYESHAAAYKRPEEVHARHILFKLAPGASEAERTATRAKATEILGRARGGEDFAALAQANSQDTSASSGGDLGFFARGVMVPTFEQTAFALAPGAISDIVESPFGLHIIKVEEKREERTESLDEVRDSIVKAIQTQRGREVALQRAEQAHERLVNGEALDAVAGSLGLQVETPGPFARNEPVTGIDQSPPVAEMVFDTDTGQIGDIATLESGYVVFRVDERIATHVPPFESAHDRVEEAVRLMRAKAAAKARAEELLKKLTEQKDIDALAAAEHLTVEETDPVGRLGGFVPPLGNAPALKEAAFRLTKEAPVAPAVYDVNGDVVIAVLKDRQPPDLGKFDEEKGALKERIRRQNEASAVQQFVSQLKGKAQIELGKAYPVPAGQ